MGRRSRRKLVWTVGAVTLSLLPVIIKSRIGGGIDVKVAINLIFAVGIAAGSLAAALLSHGRIELAPAPFLLLAIAALAIDMGLSTQAIPAASHEVPIAEFFMSAAGARPRRRGAPLFSSLGPLRRPAVRRGSGLVGRGSARARHRRSQLPELHRNCRRIAGDDDHVAACPLERADGAPRPGPSPTSPRRSISSGRLPAQHPSFQLARDMACSVPARDRGAEKPDVHRARPNIVVVDHVSWLDAPILFSLVETPATFVIEPQAAKSWPARLFLRFADARVLDPAKPLEPTRARPQGEKRTPAGFLPRHTDRGRRPVDGVF